MTDAPSAGRPSPGFSAPGLCASFHEHGRTDRRADTAADMTTERRAAPAAAAVAPACARCVARAAVLGVAVVVLLVVAAVVPAAGGRCCRSSAPPGRPAWRRVGTLLVYVVRGATADGVAARRAGHLRHRRCAIALLASRRRHPSADAVAGDQASRLAGRGDGRWPRSCWTVARPRARPPRAARCSTSPGVQSMTEPRLLLSARHGASPAASVLTSRRDPWPPRVPGRRGAFYGGLGWLLDRWLGTSLLVAIGILVGADSAST